MDSGNGGLRTAPEPLNPGFALQIGYLAEKTWEHMGVGPRTRELEALTKLAYEQPRP